MVAKKHKPTHHKEPIRPKRSKKKIVLFALLTPVLLIVLTALSVLSYVSLQKPAYVNKDLALDKKLHIPALLEPQTVDGEKVFALTAQAGQTEFLPGKQTKTLSFNGDYLGPTIRARRGDAVRFAVTNNLDEQTTVHWHGMDLPANMDGGPHQMVGPKTVWHPTWTVANPASTLWYHPHLMGKTGEQVYKGMAGLFLIDDDNADKLDLPKTYGVDDIPLVIQDKTFDGNGQFTYSNDHQDIMGHSGMHGDTIVVNGTYAPYVEAPARLVRLRLVNAANARRFTFGFADNQPFQQIASDGGLLTKPVQLTRLTLAPGERAEIVMDLTGKTTPLTLMSYDVQENNPLLKVIKNLGKATRDENQRFKILEIRPQATTEKSKPLPQTLATIEPLKPETATKTRQFVLDAQGHSINNKKMDHSRIDEIVHAGDTEIWEVQDQSGTYHPFHIHGVQFQVLSRNNNRPSENEQGWKDTVLVHSAETVKLVVRFPNHSDPHLPYMYHCHILEHEDQGMMGQFMLVSKDIKDQDVSVQSPLKDNSQHIHQH